MLRVVIFLLIALTGSLGFLGTATAVQTPVQLSPAERAWLNAHPDITFCFSDSFKTFLFLDKNQQPAGYFPEFYKLLGERLGVPLKIRVISPWPKAIEEAKARRCAGLTAVKVTDSWRADFLFSDTLRHTYMYIYTRSDQAESLRRINALYGKKTAYLRGEAGAEVLLKKHAQITGLPFDSNEEALTALQNGQVDAIIGSISMDGVRRQSNLLTLKLAALIPESRAPLVIAVRNDWPELVPIINKALADLSVEEKTDLEDRWFGESARQLLEADAGIQLTAAEKSWLAEGHTVRVRVNENPPYLLTQPVPSGISVDTLSAIAKRFGIKLDYRVESLSWDASLADVRGERAHFDLLLTMTPDPERKRDFALTSEYLSSPWVIYTRNDTPYVGSLDALKGKTVVSEKGYAITARLQAEYPGLNIQEVLRPADALKAVATGQADAYVGNLAIANYQIREKHLSNLMVSAPAPFGDNRQVMAVRKDWAVLAGLIDKGLAAMSKEERNAIQQKWGAVEYKLPVDYKLITWIVLIGMGGVLLTLYVSRRRAEYLRQLAFNDALTQLPNRRMLLDSLRHAVSVSKRQESYAAALFLDLNKFKQLNDTHGHEAGDLLLIEVAKRLKRGTRTSDTVARLGGDEFLVLMEGLGADLDKATEFATKAAEKIRQSLSEEYVLGKIVHHGSVSIGVKLFIGDKADPDQIIKEADAAMYEMKHGGIR